MTFRMREICFENAPVCGYSTTFHILLDLDDTNLIKTFRLIRVLEKILSYTSMLICLSSIKRRDYYAPGDLTKRHYVGATRLSMHIIVEKELPYYEIMDVYETLMHLGIVDPQHVEMREKRLDMTLRVSPKFPSPPPLPVIYHKHKGIDANIYTYLLALDAFREIPDYLFRLTYDGLTGNFLLVPNLTQFDNVKTLQKRVGEILSIFTQDQANLTLAVTRKRLEIESKRHQQALSIRTR